MKKPFIIFIINLFLTLESNAVCVEREIRQTEDLIIKTGLKISTHDNEILRGNLITPKSNKKKLPTIIFANSWLLDEHEYLFQAKLLARSGYQVFSYSTRGWGCSTGVVSVAGPNDVKDISTILDWLEHNTDIDINSIGISGISYGGGLTLMALAKEKRIKTGVAMSAWASLEESMLGQNTTRMFWGGALVSTGFIIGELDPDLYPLFFEISKYENLVEARSWARKRGAETYIDDIGEKPIFIANNFGDNLFQPNQIIKFFNKLKGPKILDLNQGTHVSGEATGLFKRYNYSFEKLKLWFDYFLKGIESSDLKINQITMETDLKHTREFYSRDYLKNKHYTKFYLNPRGENKWGGISKRPEALTFKRDEFSSRYDSFATTGIPILSALLDGNWSLPVYYPLYLNPKKSSLTYISEKLTEVLSIRGIPKLELRLRSQGHLPFQVVVYLYEIDSWGIGKLITHGVFSNLSSKKPTGQFLFELVATAYDLEKGSQLAIVIDGEDILYGKFPNRAERIFLEHSLFETNKILLPLK